MPLSALDRLCLVRAKVERAKKHLFDLERELAEFRDKNLTVVRKQLDPNSGHEVHEFHNVPLLSFNAICIVGDIIYNLRSSLDHLAHQLVLAAGNTPTRDTCFPIAKDFRGYESSKIGKVQGMRPEAIKAIDALKPYKGGNDALWRIHELNNIDKHRNILTVGHDYLFVDDWVPGFGPYWHKDNDPHFSGVFDDDAEKDMQLEIGKALGDPKIVNSNALLPSIHQLVDFADNLIRSFLPLLA